MAGTLEPNISEEWWWQGFWAEISSLNAKGPAFSASRDFQVSRIGIWGGDGVGILISVSTTKLSIRIEYDLKSLHKPVS